jgi:hypothetical protein
MLVAILLILLMFLAVPGQAFVPEVPILYGAMVPLVPILVFYVAAAYSLPLALLASAGVGLFWDALWGLLLPEGPSIPLGFTMLCLGMACTVYHLAAFEKQHRNLISYSLLCGGGVLALQIAEFLWVTLNSETFRFPGSFMQVGVYQRMLWSSLMALLAAPLVYGFFALLGAGRAAESEEGEGEALNSFAK